MPDVADLPLIGAAALRARAAARVLRTLPTDTKNAALAAMADALVERADEVLAANAADVEAAAADGTPESVLDRLRLDPAADRRVSPTRCATWSRCPTRSATSSAGRTLPNGLQLRQVRVPLGVVGIVYEARPNVTVDAAGLCLKSGNAALLRGSASAFRTNTALVAVLTEAAEKAGLPAGSIELLPADRASVGELLDARGLVDVVIPRGGASLIERVVREATVPVIETGVGNCHVYVDASADPAMAEAIVLNAKTHRVSVCNSAETLLVHRDVPFLPRLLTALADAGVTLHGDEAARAAHDAVVPATDEDWATEYLSMDMAVRVVDDLPQALDHIAAVGERAQRGDRGRLRRGDRRLHRRRRRRRRPGQRLDPVHRRRRVRLRRRDRHLDPEAARPGAARPAGADLDHVRRHRQRPHPLTSPVLAPEEPHCPARRRSPRSSPRSADVEQAAVRGRATCPTPRSRRRSSSPTGWASRCWSRARPASGKTELAKALATATGSELIRLQCYEGLDEARALYEWNYKKQLLRIQASQGTDGADWDTVHDDIFGEEFLLARPLLTAIRRTEPTVLLIDETDKADVEVEGLLLEVLSDFQVTIPELGHRSPPPAGRWWC